MIARFRFVVVYLLLVGAVFFVVNHQDVAVPVNKPLQEIPMRLNGWVSVDEVRFNESVLETLKPTDYLYRFYSDAEGNRVSLYLGYHAGGPDSGPIHSPKHCLPGSGWQSLEEKSRALAVEGESLSLVHSVYGNQDYKELFLYWFQVKGKTLTDEYSLKFAEVTNSILHNRRDSAFVRISVPVSDDVDAAAKAGERFIRDFYPQIAAVLPD